jgi:hypothetical protein
MGNTRITEDPRIDPRIKAVVGAIDLGLAVSDAESREQVLKEANSRRSPSAISSRGGGTVEPQLWRAGIRSVVSRAPSHPNGRPAR